MIKKSPFKQHQLVVRSLGFGNSWFGGDQPSNFLLSRVQTVFRSQLTTSAFANPLNGFIVTSLNRLFSEKAFISIFSLA